MLEDPLYPLSSPAENEDDWHNSVISCLQTIICCSILVVVELVTEVWLLLFLFWL